jgi:hypothetical protein
MGSYYSGDIEGKFWFALQPTDAPLRFGGEITQPQVAHFYFSSDDLPHIEGEIASIEKSLGDKLQVIDNFFKEKQGYNDEMLAEVGITHDELRDYADLGLGKQIRDCVKSIGDCNFEGEY